MQVIHKFPVQVRDEFEVRIPRGAMFMSVQTQHGIPQQWWMVDPKEAKESRHFRVRGTGHEFEPKKGETESFLGTFQMNEGTFVGHLFEILR